MTSILHNEILLEIPSDWDDTTKIVLVGPMKGRFRPSITIRNIHLLKPQTASDYAVEQTPGIAEAMGGPGVFEMVEESDGLIDRAKSHRQLYHGIIGSDRLAMTQLQVYIERPRGLLSILATDGRENFMESRPIAEHIIESIKIRESTI